MFQPHGYGPIAKMGEQLAESFAEALAPDDRLYLPDPVYQGGTVDRTRGSEWLASEIEVKGGHAEHVADRSEIGERLLSEARSGDRIVIMGARDDTLAEFARDLVERLKETASA
jgi:UDP-N-acetylmuramate--alanine ligase